MDHFEMILSIRFSVPEHKTWYTGKEKKKKLGLVDPELW